MKYIFAIILFLMLAINFPTAHTLPFSYDFEDVDSVCWAARPNGDENSNGCNTFTNIGKGSSSEAINRAGRFGVAHTGSYSVKITYANNEDESRFRVNVDHNHIFIRYYVYFDNNYDFGFGEKVVRANSIDSSTGTLYFDNICYIRANGASNAKDDNSSFTCEPNGGSSDFGSFSWNIVRGQWYEVQIEFQLNTPGGSNGICRVWVDDVLKMESTTLSNMRTSSRGGGYNHLTDNHNYSTVPFGGWYSNGGAVPPNSAPLTPAIKYLDNVAVSTSKISSIGGGSSGGSSFLEYFLKIIRRRR
jgi:hypothetical protein